MHNTQLADISRTGLQLAIQEIKEEMFDTPECDYTIAKLLSHCGQFEAAERHIDDMLLKWGASPDVVTLTEQAYADMANVSAASIATSPQASRRVSSFAPTSPAAIA